MAPLNLDASLSDHDLKSQGGGKEERGWGGGGGGGGAEGKTSWPVISQSS